MYFSNSFLRLYLGALRSCREAPAGIPDLTSGLKVVVSVGRRLLPMNWMMSPGRQPLTKACPTILEVLVNSRSRSRHVLPSS